MNPDNSSPFYTPMPRPPDPLGQGFDSAFAQTLPFEKVTVPAHTFVVDSRQRDCSRFPDPSYYQVYLGNIYKNIDTLELRGAAIPKTSYNIHSTNNKIDFAIGSSITHIGIVNGGSGYLTAPTITISSPNVGSTATATAIIDLGSGQVTSIVITNPGSGYSPSKPPIVSIKAPDNGLTTATAKATVGLHYTAELRTGQYVIGGNPVPPSTDMPMGLVKEVQDAMNYEVSGTYTENSTGPFEVRLVNQYPEIDADPGTPEAANSNTSMFNRIQITNVDTDYWEILFCTGSNKQRNAHEVLGFKWEDQINPYATPGVITGSGTLISAGTTYRGSFDYDLTDDPTFVALSFWTGNQSFERVSSYEPSLNRKFGVMLFDANDSDVIKDTVGTTTSVSGTNYLEGPVGKGAFYQTPGIMRPLKGFDFDQKKIQFAPSLGKFDTLSVQFTKYGLQNGGANTFYDFSGREHVLVFNVTSNDLKSPIGA